MSLSSDREFIKLSFVVVWVLCVSVAQVNSVAVDLRCDEVDSNYMTGEFSYCTVSDMHIDHNTLVNCDVYHQFRYQVRAIRFYSSRMLFVPFGLFRYFDEIRDFDISDSEVIDIPRNTFENAGRLLYLSVAHNNLTELGSSVFVGANALYMLNVSHNHIDKINRFAFSGVPALSRLDLSHNQLSNIWPELFHDVLFLERIYLNDNQLHTISSNQFMFLPQLSMIELGNNRLTELDTSIWRFNSLLESLQVSGNALQYIDTSRFPDKLRSLAINNNNLTELTVSNLIDLEASNNRIQKLDIQSPDMLQRLIVSNNSLTNIDNIMSMTNLEILDLSANCIHNNISTLASLKLLTRLNLAQTCLADLNFGIFSAQRQLKSLDISYNNLSEVHLDLFAPYLNQLESLFLDGNNLTEIGGLFQLNLTTVFPLLTTVGMSNNPFNCTYLTQLFRLFNTFNIKLPVDPDLSSVNTTHVFGIACTNNKSSPPVFKTPTDLTPNQHFLVNHHHSLIAQVDRLKLDAMISQHENELRIERLKLDQSQLHEQMLQTNLMVMKLVIGIACVVGLVVVGMKCVTFYRRNRDLMVLPTMNGNSTSLYRSTTTMNTLRSSLEPSGV